MNEIEDQKILEHVLYEFQMYIYSYDIYKNNKISEILINNIAIESHLIHLRNIIYFFQNTKKEKDDIIYCDIINKNNKLLLALDTTVINKSISHLTTERTKNKLNNYNCIIDDYYFRTITTIETFLDLLNEKSINKQCLKEISDKEIIDLIIDLKNHLNLILMNIKIIF